VTKINHIVDDLYLSIEKYSFKSTAFFRDTSKYDKLWMISQPLNVTSLFYISKIYNFHFRIRVWDISSLKFSHISA